MAYDKTNLTFRRDTDRPLTHEEMDTNFDEVGAVEDYLDSDVAPHVDSKENPHDVTADQVDTYTKSVIDQKDDNVYTNATDRSNHTGTQTLSTISDAGSAAGEDVDAFEPAGSVSSAITDHEDETQTHGTPSGERIAHTGDLQEIGLFLPIYPEVYTDDNHFGIGDDSGSVTVPSGVTLVFRGIYKYETSEETFSTVADKTYHLRMDIDGNITLNDLSDTDYNPDSLSETDESFDTTYDDMLIAKVETDTDNNVTVTNLKNKNVLRWHDEMEWFNISDSGTNDMRADAESYFNFSRKPGNYDYFLTKMDHDNARGTDIDWHQDNKEVDRYHFYIRFGIDFTTGGTFEFNASC